MPLNSWAGPTLSVELDSRLRQVSDEPVPHLLLRDAEDVVDDDDDPDLECTTLVQPEEQTWVVRRLFQPELLQRCCDSPVSHAPRLFRTVQRFHHPVDTASHALQ